MNDKAMQTQSQKNLAMEHKTVTDVKGFLEAIDDQIKISGNKSVTNYLFRGLPNSKWQVKSTAQIRLEGGAKAGASDGSIPPQDEKLYNQALIEHFKHESFNDTNSPILDTDLGILAQLRHYNCATSMIDFTGNPLVALWFACQDTENKNTKSNDGIVHTLATENTNEFIEIYSLKQLQNYKIDEIFDKYNEGRWFYWKPSHLNRRIPAQSSYFVIGKNDINEKIWMHSPIIIEQSYKKSILDALFTNHNIDALTLFPDMSGFAQANSELFPYGISEKYRREIKFRTAEILELEKEKKDDERAKLGIKFFQRGMAKHKLAQSKDSQEDINESINIFTKVIDEKEQSEYKYTDEDYDAFYYRGTAYSIQNKKQNAIDDLTKAIEIKTDSRGAYYNRGNAHFKLNELEKALNDFNKAIEAKGTDYRHYVNRGIVKKRLNKLEEAILDFNAAIDINPKSYHAHYNRGLTQKKLDKFEKAISDFDIAIDINAKKLNAYYHRGLAKSKLNNSKGAFQDFDKTINIDPKNLRAYYRRGLENIKLAKLKDAFKDFDKVLSIDHKNPRGYIGKGYAHAKLKEFDKAIKNFNEVIKLDSKSSSAYKGRGDAYAKLNKFDKAIKDFDKSIDINPKNIAAYNNRGNVYSKLKEFKKAIKDFEAVINLAPEIIFTHLSLGQTKYLAYKDTKDSKYRREAIKDLKSFVQKAENHKDAEALASIGIIGQAQKMIEKLEKVGKKKALKSKQTTKKKLPKSTTTAENKKNNKPTKSKKD